MKLRTVTPMMRGDRPALGVNDGDGTVTCYPTTWYELREMRRRITLLMVGLSHEEQRSQDVRWINQGEPAREVIALGADHG